MQTLPCRRAERQGPRDHVELAQGLCSPIYDTFWMSRGMQEFEFVYGYPLGAGLMQLMKLSRKSSEEVGCLIQEKLKETNEEASNHFGQPYYGNGGRTLPDNAEKAGGGTWY